MTVQEIVEAYSGHIEEKLQDQKYMGQVASIVASYSSQFTTRDKKQIPPEKIMPWVWDVNTEPIKTKEELKEEHERVKKLLNVS